MQNPVGVVALLVVICSNGCSVGEHPAQWAISDSAGVEIVTSLPNPPNWAVEQNPRLSLGSVDARGPTQFFRVRDIEVLDDLGLAIADQGSEEVRIFDLDGRYIGGFGGPGRGPGEFSRLEMVAEARDSIFVYDSGNDRIQVRTEGGEAGRTFRLEWFGGLLFPVHVFEDGEVLAVRARYMTELEGEGRVVDTALVSLHAPDGKAIDSLRRVPHNERFVRRAGAYQTTLIAPFSSSAGLVGTNRGFCHAFGVVPEIRCFDGSGRLTRIARVALEPRTVTEEDIERYWRLMESRETSYSQTVLEHRDGMIFPSEFPAISQLLQDDENRLWARRHRPETDDASHESWWIFEEGRLVATLSTPEGFHVQDVESGLIAGVWTDEIGVEHVRVYAFDYVEPRDSS